MTVQSFTPGQDNAMNGATDIGITESAITHLTSKMEEQPSAQGVRISVKPSGCSGYMYVLDYAEAPKDKDTLIKVNEQLTLFVDTDSLPMLKGTEVDYVKQGLNATLQFKNPNVTGECGCGESFTVN